MCRRWRAAIGPQKVIGSDVLNDANERIGKIEDLLVTRDGKDPYAVLSIGGFLGMGTHLVVVRYDTLTFANNKIVLPGGSKDGLRMLPTLDTLILYSDCPQCRPRFSSCSLVGCLTA